MPVPTTIVVPLIRCADLRCTQVIEARSALTGKVCAHSRYRRIKLVGLNHQRGSGPNEVRATCSERSEEQSKGYFWIHRHQQSSRLLKNAEFG
jgi:hypothetical protein